MYEEEAEWLSNCCSAPPLFELHEEEDMDTIGICGQCKEHAAFEIWGDEDEYDKPVL
tara:strand:+ start:187 stop:357 length:171 start_codon:yes stop_codon:yes gene_type:complete